MSDNPNNPNCGGKGEGPHFVSGTGDFEKSQVAAVEIPSYGGNDFNLTQKGDTARPAPKSVNDFDPRILA